MILLRRAKLLLLALALAPPFAASERTAIERRLAEQNPGGAAMPASDLHAETVL